MKIPAIKKLVEQCSLAELNLAEDAILNESKPEIEIEGNDEGEQLTHILAAKDILVSMQEKQLSSSEALRAYTQRVRNSIS